MDHFTKQLRNSGYSQKQASEVVYSAIKGIMKKRVNRMGKIKRYKSGEETLEDRITKKLTEATSWFRTKERNENEKTEETVGEENQLCKDKFKEETRAWKSWRIDKRGIRNKIKKNLAGKIICENEKKTEKKRVLFSFSTLNTLN